MITINNQNQQNKYNKPAFGNAAVNGFMNYLATNQAIGASATDMAFMVIPRTTIDLTRTPEAGIETGRRELASCLLYAGMGFFGLGAGMLIGAMYANKKYDIPMHKISAGSSTIESLSHNWNESLDKHGRDLSNKEETIESFLNKTFDSVSGLNGETKTAFNAKENETIQKELVKDLKELIKNDSKTYSIPKDKKTEMVRKIILATGSGEHLTLVNKAKEIEVNGKKQFEEIKISAGDLLENVHSLGKTFTQEKVAEEFKKHKELKDNEFLKTLGKFNSKKMFIGLGAASAVALAMQAVNRWLTKKKTGSDGFQVYKDGNGKKAQKDKSTGFQVLKGLAATAMGAYTIRTIGGKLKDIPKKIEFTKLMPNMSQYKFIYGVSIIGRLLAASDKNELRETSTRDFLGFTSWLVLGDVASRSVAKYFETRKAAELKGIKLLNCADSKLTGFKKLMESSIKSHEEILYAEKATQGKSIKEASKLASDGAKKALRYLNIAQLSGYAFSGALLGIFIPILNKTITNKLHEKELAKEKKQAEIKK